MASGPGLGRAQGADLALSGAKDAPIGPQGPVPDDTPAPEPPVAGDELFGVPVPPGIRYSRLRPITPQERSQDPQPGDIAAD